MIGRFLNKETKSISAASLILFTSYLASAILGLFRERLLAGRIGTEKLDIYYAAFVVPDFIALIFIFGAISAAIIPIFSSYYVKSKDQAWKYAANLLNVFFLFLILVVVVLIFLSPFIVSWIAPGFSEAKKADTVLLMRILFLSPIILGISNVISGLLQFFHRFLVTALAPLMYNIGIILGILLFVPFFGLAGLALGVILGALLHLFIQIPAFFYSGFKYQKIFSFGNEGVKKTITLMIPRSIGLGAGQINTIVITSIASTLATGSVAVFTLASNLSTMAVNAIAVSLSTAIFPAMSMAFSKDDEKDFDRKFSGAFCQILFLIVPLSCLIFILRAQIVRVVLGVGKFTWLDTRLTAACLGLFAVGLLGQALILLLSKTFYAAHNTKIPATVSVLTVALNVAMSFWFVHLLSLNGAFYNFLQYLLKLQGIADIRIAGLALAFSITMIIEASVLLFMLYKKLKNLRFQNVSNSIYNIFTASLFATIVAFWARHALILFEIVKLETFLGVLLQLVVAGAMGVIAYIGASYFLNSQELHSLINNFFRYGTRKH